MDISTVYLDWSYQLRLAGLVSILHPWTVQVQCQDSHNPKRDLNTYTGLETGWRAPDNLWALGENIYSGVGVWLQEVAGCCWVRLFTNLLMMALSSSSLLSIVCMEKNICLQTLATWSLSANWKWRMLTLKKKKSCVLLLKPTHFNKCNCYFEGERWLFLKFPFEACLVSSWWEFTDRDLPCKSPATTCQPEV